MNASPQTSTHDGRLLAIALTVLLAFGAAFHFATRLSVVLFGGRLHASISDSLAALVRIWGTAANPSQAWELPATAELHPVGFWLAQCIVLMSGALIAIMAWRLYGQRFGTRDHFGIRGYAGLAKRHDLKSLTIREPQPGRLTLGRNRSQLLATEPQASLAVVGPTGCGKTAGFAIPALLEWEGPIIATSVKADLIATTITARQRKGKVWVYDPTKCAGVDSHTWTPLASCGEWQGAQQMAAWMCEAAQPRFDTVSDGDYWYTQARKALAPYLYAAATSERTISDVVTWIDTQEVDQVELALRKAASLDEEIELVIDSPLGEQTRVAVRKRLRPRIVSAMRDWFISTGDQFSEYAEQAVSEWPSIFQAQLDERLDNETPYALRQAIEAELRADTSMRERLAPLLSARGLWDKDQRLRDSVFATVENLLSAYADPSVGESSKSCELDFDEWLSGDNTIYVVASSHEQARLRPVLTTLVQQSIRRAFDSAMQNGGTLTQPCLVLLDEAGNIAPLRDLPAYASTARSHGISLVTIWQDLAQIKAIYRDRAQTVLNNHRAKLFGTGIADEQTLEYVSRLIGEVARTERNFSRDLGGDRRSVSEHTSYRRAAPVDVLRRIRINEAVLLYGSVLPVHLRLRPWFSDKSLLAISSGSNHDNNKEKL